MPAPPLLLLVDFTPALAADYETLFTAAGYIVRITLTTALTTPLRTLPRPALLLYELTAPLERNLAQALALIRHPALVGIPLLLITAQDPAALGGRDLSGTAAVLTLPVADAVLLTTVAQILAPPVGI